LVEQTSLDKVGSLTDSDEDGRGACLGLDKGPDFTRVAACLFTKVCNELCFFSSFSLCLGASVVPLLSRFPEAVQKVLSTDSVASRIDKYRRNMNLNVGEMAFRPTFWTASKSGRF